LTIRAVFFDLYNTLAGFDPPRDVIQARAAEQVGLRLTKAGVDAGYLEADAFMARQNAGPRPVRAMAAAERDAFFARFEQLVLGGAGHSVSLELASEVWRLVRQQTYSLALFPDVLPGLKALRDGGYILGVITNLDMSGAAVLERFGLAGHIGFAATSRDAGAEKPHPPVFLAALKLAGAAPHEAVHVGDQLDSDIAGAESAGIRAVLMDRTGGHRGYTKHPRVEGMADVPAALAAFE
jgi:putative hydrolase of the HAD superfamily